LKLNVDVREGVSGHELDFENPSVEFVVEWLKRLDGARHTLLCLDRSDGWRMMIGGGPAHFIVALEDDKRSLTFLDPSSDKTAILSLCAGGQFGDFAARNCTDQDGAARLMRSFFWRTEAEVTWEEAK
jgi:hypothetical protein